MSKNVYIVGGSTFIGYVNWLGPLGFAVTNKLENADLVFFTGGSDVSPNIYNHERHYTTGPSPERDKYELEKYKEALSLNKKMWGCCRGSQFLCAVQPGGYLIQDMEHPSSHIGIVKETGEKLVLTSSHHQMAAPFDINHRILVYSDNLSPHHELGDCSDLKIKEEPEIVFYPDIQAVGSQSHVEWQFNKLDKNSDRTVKFHQELVTNLLLEKL